MSVAKFYQAQGKKKAARSGTPEIRGSPSSYVVVARSLIGSATAFIFLLN